jgi:hypothetical protein
MFKAFIFVCLIVLVYIYYHEYTSQRSVETSIVYGRVIGVNYHSDFGHSTDRFIVIVAEGDTTEVLNYKINKNDSVKVTTNININGKVQIKYEVIK